MIHDSLPRRIYSQRTHADDDSYKFENTEDGVFCYDSITDVWKKMNVVGDPDVYIRSQFAACVNQQERTIYFTAGVIVSYNGKIIIVNV